MTIEERLTRLEDTVERLEGIVEKLATNTTAFVQSATEFNATVTSAIGTTSSAIGTLSQVIESQGAIIHRLDEMVRSFDEWLRGQGPQGWPRKEGLRYAVVCRMEAERESPWRPCRSDLRKGFRLSEGGRSHCFSFLLLFVAPAAWLPAIALTSLAPSPIINVRGP